MKVTVDRSDTESGDANVITVEAGGVTYQITEDPVVPGALLVLVSGKGTRRVLKVQPLSGNHLRLEGS